MKKEAYKKVYCNKGYLNALGFDKSALLRDLISLSGGKIFSGSFIKADGSKRVFNAKQFIVGSVVGGKSTLNQEQIAWIDNEKYIELLRDEPEILGESSDERKARISKKCWRSFKVSKLKTLRVNGVEHIFDVD